MRTIKFRAWDKKNGSMLQEVSTGTIEIWCAEDGRIAKSSDCAFMQFTGMEDSNGKEIYEGDILKTYPILGSDKIGDSSFKVIVEWSECGWIANGALTGYHSRISEVVGNIHENKHLTQSNEN